MFDAPPPSTTATKSAPASPPPYMRFHFPMPPQTKESLALISKGASMVRVHFSNAVLERLQRELGGELTKNDIVVALLWRARLKAELEIEREKDNNNSSSSSSSGTTAEPPMLLMPFNFRNKYKVAVPRSADDGESGAPTTTVTVPSHYCGNAIGGIVVRAPGKAAVADEQSLRQVAQAVHDTVRGGDALTKGLVDALTWEAQREGARRGDRILGACALDQTAVTSWRNFNVSQHDYHSAALVGGSGTMPLLATSMFLPGPFPNLCVVHGAHPVLRPGIDLSLSLADPTTTARADRSSPAAA
jgi:hypothetical protein